jgi:hypothetical protein
MKQEKVIGLNSENIMRFRTRQGLNWSPGKTVGVDETKLKTRTRQCLIITNRKQF